MGNLYSKHFKNCARCSQWGGKRQVVEQGQKVEVSSMSSLGKCSAQGGPWEGEDVKAADTCKKWDVWAELK